MDAMLWVGGAGVLILSFLDPVTWLRCAQSLLAKRQRRAFASRVAHSHFLYAEENQRQAPLWQRPSPRPNELATWVFNATPHSAIAFSRHCFVRFVIYKGGERASHREWSSSSNTSSLVDERRQGLQHARVAHDPLQKLQYLQRLCLGVLGRFLQRSHACEHDARRRSPSPVLINSTASDLHRLSIALVCLWFGC